MKGRRVGMCQFRTKNQLSSIQLLSDIVTTSDVFRFIANSVSIIKKETYNSQRAVGVYREVPTSVGSINGTLIKLISVV